MCLKHSLMLRIHSRFQCFFYSINEGKITRKTQNLTRTWVSWQQKASNMREISGKIHKIRSFTFHYIFICCHSIGITMHALFEWLRVSESACVHPSWGWNISYMRLGNGVSPFNWLRSELCNTKPARKIANNLWHRVLRNSCAFVWIKRNKKRINKSPLLVFFLLVGW